MQQDQTEQVTALMEDWVERGGDAGSVSASDPASGHGLVITKLVAEGNHVSVWTDDYEGESPEYVIVNPPIKYMAGKLEVTDPVTALAVSILGVRK